jgi:D-alanyl-D-alanine carboxypeptidase
MHKLTASIRLLAFIISVCLIGTAASAALGQEAGQAAAASPGTLEAKIDSLLSPVFKLDTPGAAIIVMKDGKPLLRKAYGTANLELGVAMEPDHVFRIGSMTKQFTAVAVLMLMEQGKLALNDPITKFLPDYPVGKRMITVEHLLTHTSGIKSYTDLPEWLPLQRKDMTVSELIALSKDKPAEFQPGERWSYCNSGYVLLGAIIEKAAATSYETFLQKNIFEPLGLKHTCYDNTMRIIPGRIPGYGPGGTNGFVNADYLSMTQPYAAGSLLSTVDDLAAWNEALLAGKLIKRETLEKAWTDHKLKDGSATGYGYGWGVGAIDGKRMVSHSGGIPGFASDGILLPKERLQVILLTNSTLPARAPGRFTPTIAGLALGKPLPSERKAVAIDPKIFDQYAGEYELQPGFVIKFFRQGDKFMTQATGQGAIEIFPESETKFFLKVVDGQVEFVKDAAGKVTGMTLTQNGRALPAKRIK